MRSARILSENGGAAPGEPAKLKYERDAEASHGDGDKRQFPEFD